MCQDLNAEQMMAEQLQVFAFFLTSKSTLKAPKCLGIKLLEHNCMKAHFTKLTLNPLMMDLLSLNVTHFHHHIYSWTLLE